VETTLILLHLDRLWPYINLTVDKRSSLIFLFASNKENEFDNIDDRRGMSTWLAKKFPSRDESYKTFFVTIDA
jgi:hypothetical protein